MRTFRQLLTSLVNYSNFEFSIRCLQNMYITREKCRQLQIDFFLILPHFSKAMRIHFLFPVTACIPFKQSNKKKFISHFVVFDIFDVLDTVVVFGREQVNLIFYFNKNNFLSNFGIFLCDSIFFINISPLEYKPPDYKPLYLLTQILFQIYAPQL